MWTTMNPAIAVDVAAAIARKNSKYGSLILKLIKNVFNKYMTRNTFVRVVFY